MHQMNASVFEPQRDTPEIPLGLGMSLAQHPDAMTAYGRMNSEQKQRIVQYIQDSTTGDEARQRIRQTVQMLLEREDQN